ncbi:Antilisterial bacteriocin subtilosin biosynthesis protein AlbA [Symmachiella dynata]|uniref:radical SAM protein n=1 Tax=Symmachiella dynata TaxID=2527995 RepID=UPI0011898EFF|nr:radical SAM protein [Symmachiella dynata]QDT48378.1 Antilisterial bacteriocin subtilosin biosynthesis protein AlbA [Symmachiella dynata]
MSIADIPSVELQALDELWFQVSGTLCNLQCTHCFISCSPHNDSFGYLSLDEVQRRLEESVAFGVKEYYFTGGEPFLNKELIAMLTATLAYGPATVLTNATVLKPEWLRELRAAEERAVYSLEIRVSIDGPSAAINDPIRGKGTFERAMQGVRLLVEHGFLPIITMTRTWDEADDPGILSRFREALHELGYRRPRLKILPRLQIGAETQRTHGYDANDVVTQEMLADYDVGQLICAHSRVITDRGVCVCPILLDSPAAHLGETLAESTSPFPLVHGACYTCYQYGAICTNPSSQVVEQQRAADSKIRNE